MFCLFRFDSCLNWFVSLFCGQSLLLIKSTILSPPSEDSDVIYSNFLVCLSQRELFCHTVYCAHFVADGAKSKADAELLKQKVADIDGVENITISSGLDSVTVTLKGLLPDALR